MKIKKSSILGIFFLATALFCLSNTWTISNSDGDWSARRTLITIYTKSLTGEKRAVEKAITSLRAIYDEMESRNQLRPDSQVALLKAIQYLEQNPIDDFNYFDFYQKYFLPLYEQLPIDNEGMTTSDANAKGIFDKAFLNPLAFAELEKDSFWDARFELGKLLFHDPLMSGNNKRSCASCHQANKGFGDGVAKSVDFDSTSTVDRNSPTLINAVFARPYLHDLSQIYLERQFHQVLEHPKELRTKYWEIVRKVSHSPEYVTRFKTAFPNTPKINTENIEISLKTYVASLVALNSDFDKMMRSEIPVNQEITKGYDVFMGKAQCGSCHYPPLFSGLQPPFYENAEGHAMGVPASAKKPKLADKKDLGAALIPKPDDMSKLYQFKTPTLRNLAHTAPYMHNGVFATLDAAVDFMCSGGNIYKGRARTTAPSILTAAERQSLMSFLNSLNDTDTGRKVLPERLPTLVNFGESVSREVLHY